MLHHGVPFGDAAQRPAEAQARLRRHLERAAFSVADRRHGRSTVAAFRRRTGKTAATTRRETRLSIPRKSS